MKDNVFKIYKLKTDIFIYNFIMIFLHILVNYILAYVLRFNDNKIIFLLYIFIWGLYKSPFLYNKI